MHSWSAAAAICSLRQQGRPSSGARYSGAGHAQAAKWATPTVRKVCARGRSTTRLFNQLLAARPRSQTIPVRGSIVPRTRDIEQGSCAMAVGGVATPVVDASLGRIYDCV